MGPLNYACILLFPLVSGLIGYDGGGHGLNITTLSLLDVSDCEHAEVHTIAEEAYIQLLQLSDYGRTKIQHCKVEIDRTIFYCGMHSHISAVHNGRRIYFHTLSNSGCQRLHETGTLFLGGNAIISGAVPNSTMTSSINLAGLTTEDGRCSGTQYSDPYSTWDEVMYKPPSESRLKTTRARSNVQRRN